MCSNLAAEGFLGDEMVKEEEEEEEDYLVGMDMWLMACNVDNND